VINLVLTAFGRLCEQPTVTRTCDRILCSKDKLAVPEIILTSFSVCFFLNNFYHAHPLRCRWQSYWSAKAPTWTIRTKSSWFRCTSLLIKRTSTFWKSCSRIGRKWTASTAWGKLPYIAQRPSALRRYSAVAFQCLVSTIIRCTIRSSSCLNRRYAVNTDLYF